MRDIALSELLSSRGFEGDGAELALDELRRLGLTRRGKRRIAASKLGAVAAALNAAFRRVCAKTECGRIADPARLEIRVSEEHCEVCGGSDNRRAIEEMLAAMRRAGLTKLLVAGGSPGTRGDLERLCAGRCRLQFVTEDTTPNRRTVRPLLDWSDVTVIWASTEISHKATSVLRGRKVLKVTRRGVAALARAVANRCRDPDRSRDGANTRRA